MFNIFKTNNNMELRTKAKSSEFKSLHAKLNDLGLYEKGMNLDQMRQVMGAVDESINEAPFSDQDMEFAMRVSERDFVSANICNSTMINPSENDTRSVFESSFIGQGPQNFMTYSSPYSSPEIGCVQKMTVVAEVHHELNWTPKRTASGDAEKKRMSRKRTSDALSGEDSGVMLSSNSLFETTSF